MKHFIISEELATKVLNYLANRPLIEVDAMFHELQNIKPVVEQAPVPEQEAEPKQETARKKGVK